MQIIKTQNKLMYLHLFFIPLQDKLIHANLSLFSTFFTDKTDFGLGSIKLGVALVKSFFKFCRVSPILVFEIFFVEIDLILYLFGACYERLSPITQSWLFTR